MRKNRIYTDILLNGFHHSGNCHGYIGNKHIFLGFGIPGEWVDAEDVRHEGDHLRGRVKTVKSHSTGRVNPGCRHFGICGGCNWQHLDYGEQLKWKRQLLNDSLQKQGIPFPEIPITIPSPELSSFRNRLDYTFSTRRWYYENEGKVVDAAERLALGFHPEGNPFKTVDILECFLQGPPSRKICEFIKSFTSSNGYSYHDPKEDSGFMRALTIRVNRRAEAMVILTFRMEDEEKINRLLEQLLVSVPSIKSLWWAIVPEIDKTWAETELFHFPGTEKHLTEEANGLVFRISPKSFYQPNPAQAEQIFAKIREVADLKGDEFIYDLYSGIGTISLTIAHNARKVIGIEGNADAVEDARQNAILNQLGNCTFFKGDVLGTFNPAFIAENGRPDLIILDPPRAGTLIEIKNNILASAPRKIIYLSCDPRSLAHDLKMLTQSYRISYIQPFDQFPFTHHLETLVLLEK